MVTSDKLKIFFPFFFFSCFNFFPKIHLCTNNWHRRETFGYAVEWVSRGEKEKNKMLPGFLGVRDAPGPGSSIHHPWSWCDTANLARAWCWCQGFPSSPQSKLSMRSSHRLAVHACSHGGLALSLETWVMGWWVSSRVEVRDHSVTAPGGQNPQIPWVMGWKGTGHLVPHLVLQPLPVPLDQGVFPSGTASLGAPEGAQPTGPQQCHCGVTWPCLLTCHGTGRCW